jgi:hypothetical protein
VREENFGAEAGRGIWGVRHAGADNAADRLDSSAAPQVRTTARSLALRHPPPQGTCALLKWSFRTRRVRAPDRRSPTQVRAPRSQDLDRGPTPGRPDVRLPRQLPQLPPMLTARPHVTSRPLVDSAPVTAKHAATSRPRNLNSSENLSLDASVESTIRYLPSHGIADTTSSGRDPVSERASKNRASSCRLVHRTPPTWTTPSRLPRRPRVAHRCKQLTEHFFPPRRRGSSFAASAKVINSSLRKSISIRPSSRAVRDGAQLQRRAARVDRGDRAGPIDLVPATTSRRGTRLVVGRPALAGTMCRGLRAVKGVRARVW